MLRDPDSERPWVPRADVFLNSVGEFTIKVELAALRREDLELCIEGQGVRITGHRPDTDRAASSSQYLVTGINWGWFDMVVEVPPGFDLTRATAQYQNGLLRVLVPQTS
jgi:HSP20 family molecular chaperone IbpA